MWSVISRACLPRADKDRASWCVPRELKITTRSTFAELSGKWKISGGSRRVMYHGEGRVSTGMRLKSEVFGNLAVDESIHVSRAVRLSSISAPDTFLGNMREYPR